MRETSWVDASLFSAIIFPSFGKCVNVHSTFDLFALHHTVDTLSSEVSKVNKWYTYIVIFTSQKSGLAWHAWIRVFRCVRVSKSIGPSGWCGGQRLWVLVRNNTILCITNIMTSVNDRSFSLRHTVFKSV